jgi:hypothetical protein
LERQTTKRALGANDDEEEEARTMARERRNVEGSEAGEHSGGVAVAKGSQGKGVSVAEEVVVPYGGRGEVVHEA